MNAGSWRPASTRNGGGGWPRHRASSSCDSCARTASTLPAVLFANLDDDERARYLERTLAPLTIGSSHLGIREIGALLHGAVHGALPGVDRGQRRRARRAAR